MELRILPSTEITQTGHSSYASGVVSGKRGSTSPHHEWRNLQIVLPLIWVSFLHRFLEWCFLLYCLVLSIPTQPFSFIHIGSISIGSLT